MADQIFISHSREDTDLLDELDRVFGKVGLKQYRASFEDQIPPVSKNLKNQINESRGMFVVLGRRAQAQTHTMIWIGWEAGIAIQAGIPVWIVNDIKSNVELPIPSFTDYVLWDSQDDEQKRTLRDVIHSEFVDGEPSSPSDYEKPGKVEEGIGFTSNRNRANVRESWVVSHLRGIECPYEGCGERYAIRFEGPIEFNCPACRRAIILDDSESRLNVII